MIIITYQFKRQDDIYKLIETIIISIFYQSKKE